MDVIYDGECPFCTHYVTLLKLREKGIGVQLHDAREDQVRQRFPVIDDYDLNEGMLVLWQGRTYFGAEAVHIISAVSDNAPLGFMLKNECLSRALYPFFRFCRNSALFLKGVKPL